MKTPETQTAEIFYDREASSHPHYCYQHQR